MPYNITCSSVFSNKKIILSEGLLKVYGGKQGFTKFSSLSHTLPLSNIPLFFGLVCGQTLLSKIISVSLHAIYVNFLFCNNFFLHISICLLKGQRGRVVDKKKHIS